MKSKSMFVTGVLLLGSFLTKAQDKPEKVNSIVREVKPYEWYAKQFELWSKELGTKSKNGEGWENLYCAARMARITAQSAELKAKWSKDESNVVDLVTKNIKDTYSFYRIMSWEYSIWQSKDPAEQDKIMQYSLKAYQINPSNPDIYPELVNIYEVYKFNPEKLTEVSKSWKASGDHTPALMALAYNMLISVKQNGILITGGDNDTYPLIISQYADNFRKDVTVLNIYLATIPYYRNRIFKQLGIPALEGENIEFEAVISHIAKHKKDRELYFSNNGLLNKDSSFNEKLYNIGVIYQYSESKFNNEALIVDNFENKMLTDHLYYSFYQSCYPLKDQQLNCMYLSGLSNLYTHYNLIGDKIKAERTKQVILDLTKDDPMFDEMLKQLRFE